METHAHLVIAPSIKEAQIDEALKRETADIRHVIVESFGIKDARSLIEQSGQKPLTSGKYNFIVFARALTLEAQNALLKLFEEPPKDTVFYLVVPNEAALIATLRSRLIMTSEETRSEDTSGANEFLGQGLKERLENIAILAKNEPEKIGLLAEEIARLIGKEAGPEAKRSLFLTLKYVYNRGAARKMLLEELALSLPTKNK